MVLREPSCWTCWTPVNLTVPPHSGPRVGPMLIALWKRHLVNEHFRCVSKKPFRMPTIANLIASVHQYRPIQAPTPLYSLALRWLELAQVGPWCRGAIKDFQVMRFSFFFCFLLLFRMPVN